MKPIDFWKMNGSGNDFILIDNRDGRIRDDEMAHLVSRVCRRRYSVGADGLIFVTRSERFDFGWRFFNADGGEVEMCGNGSRCVARFACAKEITGPKMTFETLAGPITAEVLGRRVKVLMPLPSGFAGDLNLEHQPGWQSVDFINTGVPHVVIQVDDINNHPVLDQGRSLRYHGQFAPEGTNVDFMKVVGPGRIRVRTYERGVEDETLACGTGAMACALVAVIRGLVKDSPVAVEARSGENLSIHFRQAGIDFDEVLLEGNTSIVYQARLDDEALT